MKKEVLIRLAKLHDYDGDLSKKWFVYFYVRNPGTGKLERVRKYESINKFKTAEERTTQAKERIEYYNNLLKSGWSPFEDDSEVIYSDSLQYKNLAEIYGRKRAGNRTFAFYANKFLESLSGLESETKQTYGSKLRMFDNWLSANGKKNDDICYIDNPVIIQFFKWLIDERQLSRKSVRDYNRLMTKVFDIAVSDKVIPTNVVANIPACTRTPDHAPRPIQEADMLEFLENIDKNDPQLGLVIRFEFNCFLRPHKEIRFMQVKWIDFVAGTITVPKSILKTKHDRIAIIPRNFLVMLRNHYQLHTYPKEYYVIGKSGCPSEMHWGKNTMKNHFNKVREELKMPKEYKLYSWKHSGNVRAERLDMPTVDRMYQNGHTSIITTERYVRNKIGRSGNSFSDFESI